VKFSQILIGSENYAIADDIAALFASVTISPAPCPKLNFLVNNPGNFARFFL